MSDQSKALDSVPAGNIPLNIKGAYVAPAIPENLDLSKAGEAEFTSYGIPWREPHEEARLVLRQVLPRNRQWIIPKLQTQKGRTHLLRGGKKRADTSNALNTNWSGGIVLASTAPKVVAANSLDGYATVFNEQEHINFIGSDNHVHELWYDNAWHHNDLTQLAGAPNAINGSALDGYSSEFNNQQHVNFIDINSHVHELWYDNAWHHNDLSQLAGAPNAINGSALDGYSTEYNKQQHVNFIDANNHVHELWYDNAWHHNDLTQAAGAPNPINGSALDGYSSEFNNQQHVNYIGTNNYVHELWYDNAWHDNDLTSLAEAFNSPAAVGSRLDGYPTEYNKQQHVNFIDANDHVHELWYDNAWHHNDLTQAAGAPNPINGSALDGYSSEYNKQQHVNFIDANNHVHELWYDNAWHHNDLTQQSAAPTPKGGTPLVGYAASFNKQQHVIYIGTDSDVHELWF
jgi:hypothetical protein